MTKNRPYHIIILAEDYPPNFGGIADYSYNLCLSLTQMGHHLNVVAPRLSGDKAFDSNSPFPVKRIGIKNIRKKYLNLLKRYKANKIFKTELLTWYKTIVKKKIDFAIVCSISEWAFVLEAKVPYAVCVHGGDAFAKRADFLRTLYRTFVNKKIISNAELICTNSNYLLEKLKKKLQIKKPTLVTYCGVSKEFTELALSTEPVNKSGHKAHLLMMCRLEPIKACDIVIKAFSKLAQQMPGIRLTIAGDGQEKKQLQTLAEQLNLSDKIDFLGYVHDIKKKVNIFKQSDIFVHSGRKDFKGREEAFGIVFAEAGLCRLPVVTAKVGGVLEVIKHNVTGFLIDPGNVDAYVDALKVLIEDPLKAEEMGANGFKRVLEYYNYDLIAEKLVDKMSLFT